MRGKLKLCCKIVFLQSAMGVRMQAIPDLEVGVTRLLHQTASPSETYKVLCAFGGMASQLGLPPAQDRAAGPCQLGALGVKSELLRDLLKQATDPDMETVALSMLGCLNKHAAEENDLINLITDKEQFPEVRNSSCQFPVSTRNVHVVAFKALANTNYLRVISAGIPTSC